MASKKKTIAIEEAAALASVPVIRVTDAWLTTAANAEKRSVFGALIEWLKSEHAATEPRRDLHNRIFSGDALMKRLVAAETKRVKKRHGLTGDKLKRQVSYSNLDSGPKESRDGCELKGDGLFVVPPSAD